MICVPRRVCAIAKVDLLKGLLPQRGALRPMNQDTVPLGIRSLAVGNSVHISHPEGT